MDFRPSSPGDFAPRYARISGVNDQARQEAVGRKQISVAKAFGLSDASSDNKELASQIKSLEGQIRDSKANEKALRVELEAVKLKHETLLTNHKRMQQNLQANINAATQPLEAQIANLTSNTLQQAELASEIRSLEGQIKDGKANEKDLKSQLEAMRERNQSLAKDYRILQENQQDKVNQATKSLKEKIDELENVVQTVGYKQATPSQRNKESDIDFYAGIIDIPSMKELLDGWEVQIRNWEEYQKLHKNKGTIISVIGNYSKGKTFLLELLTQASLPHGFNVNTQGISIVYLKDENDKQKPIVALDTKGGGNALHINPNSPHSGGIETKNESEALTDKLRDHSATEDLLQNFILEVASIVIIVVSDLTFDDQKLVNKITNKFKGDNSKKIIVVHNLYHVHYNEEVNNKIHNTILRAFHLEEMSFKTIANDQNNVYFVDKTRGSLIPHVVLAKQHTEAGKYYNKSTIEYITQSINTNDSAKSVDIIEVFHGYLQKNLCGYIQAEQELTAQDIVLIKNEEGKPLKIRVENVNGLQMKAVYADVFGDLQIFKDGMRPNCSLTTESNDLKREQICLRIECPGECTDVKSRVVPMNGHEFCIRVKGLKGSAPRKESIIANSRQFGEFFIEIPNLSTAQYRIKNTVPQKEIVDGIAILRWDLEPPAEDDWD